MFCGTAVPRQETNFTHEDILTVPDICRKQDLELSFDIRVEQAMEVEMIWPPFPVREIRDLVTMQNVTLRSQLADVAHLRVYCSKEQSRVGDITVRDV